MDLSKIHYEIRECRLEDLLILEKELPSSGFSHYHEQYYKEQVDGQATYLIAWYEGKPVGKLLINWNGNQYAQIKQYINNCPTLIAIETKKEMRNKGVATQLIAYAEEQVKAKQFQKVGMEVALANDEAKRLYEKLGYKDYGHEKFLDEWVEVVDKAGRKIIHQDPSTFYIKYF